LIAGVYAGLRDDLQSGGVECRLDFTPGLPHVLIDYKTIGYCVRSILNNAIEAMPGGGKITITTTRTEDAIAIVIADTGPGMTEETVRLATTPYFSTKDQGSGLGLSLCTRILEGHGADFDIHSAEGAGTTFTIRLKTPKEENDGQTAGS
jgi:signal transduction histidine kinase